MSDLQSTSQIQSFDEDFAAFETTVAVFVRKDQYAIQAFPVGTLLRVAFALQNPDPAAGVKRKRDRLKQLRFRSNEFHGEPSRHVHLAHRISPGALVCGGSRVWHKVAQDRILHQRRRRCIGKVSWLLGMKAEVVEIHVSPTTRTLVHQTHLDPFPRISFQF